MSKKISYHLRNGIFPAITVNKTMPQSSAIAATTNGELLNLRELRKKRILPSSSHQTAATPYRALRKLRM